MSIDHAKDLLTEIRVAYSALLKKREGLPLTDREIEALDYVYPVDVTRVLFNEIDNLNKQIETISHENAELKIQLSKEIKSA